MLSFWEKNSFTEYDVIIIGSGIVGLSAACSIREKSPGTSVLVLERGIFPSGASTKNAGFACFAKACEMLSDLQLVAPDEAARIAWERYEGLQKLRARLGDEAIDYQQLGGNELIFGEDEFDPAQLDYLNELLHPYFGTRVFEMRDEKIAAYGFANTRHLVHTPLEGQVDTGKMMKNLLQKALSLGVMVINGAEVLHIETSAHEVEVKVLHFMIQTEVVFKAAKVAVCTSALTSRFLPQYTVTPGRGQVLITHPISGLPFRGTFHFDEGYYYFRNYGNRVLFGGGRNLDMATESSSAFRYNPAIQTRLEELLAEVILPGTPFEIDQRWTGIMGFTPDKRPVVEAVNDRTVVGFSCNGMGVALGSSTGEKVAALLGIS